MIPPPYFAKQFQCYSSYSSEDYDTWFFKGKKDLSWPIIFEKKRFSLIRYKTVQMSMRLTIYASWRLCCPAAIILAVQDERTFQDVPSIAGILQLTSGRIFFPFLIGGSLPWLSRRNMDHLSVTDVSRMLAGDRAVPVWNKPINCIAMNFAN